MKDLKSLKNNSRVKPSEILKMKCDGYTNEQLSTHFNMSTTEVEKQINSALFNLSRSSGNSYSTVINLLKKESKKNKLYSICSIIIELNESKQKEFKCKEGMVQINIQYQIDNWENIFGRPEIVKTTENNKDYYNVTFKSSPGVRGKITVIHPN